MKKLLIIIAAALLLSSNANSVPSILSMDDTDGTSVRLLDRISDSLSEESTTITAPIFTLEEEAYVDDIPFNTRKIFEENTTNTAPIFTLEEEAYIDDIPFDTKKIVKSLK